MTNDHVALHQTVATMANHAAQLVDQGHYSMAARELTEALSVNKHALSISSEGRSLHAASRRPQESSSGASPPSLLRQVCLASGGVTANNKKLDEETNLIRSDDAATTTESTGRDFVLCSNTLYIPTGEYHGLLETPLETHMVLSAVILFNLALCYHLAALNMNKEDTDKNFTLTRREALCKACSLYSLHYQMLATEEDQDFDAVKVMLLLASINNLGHVNTLLGEDAAANKCFQWMLNTLLLLVNSRQWTQRIEGVSLEGFFQNTVHLVLTASNTARAA
eukprot:Nitzschia sp. Nitz4//scaffold30_size153850//66942//67781//NITZ4_002776-RA/size153850-processed-gene-0.12-mRNA-1//1//CDS//3329547258//4174//frame0